MGKLQLFQGGTLLDFLTTSGSGPREPIQCQSECQTSANGKGSANTPLQVPIPLEGCQIPPDRATGTFVVHQTQTNHDFTRILDYRILHTVPILQRVP